MSLYRVAVGNKVVGVEILNEGDRVIAVRRAQPKHMLRKPPSWAFSKEVVDFMQEKAVNEIRVFCDGLVYTCSLKDFLRLSIPINRGEGEQRALPLRYWSKKTDRG